MGYTLADFWGGGWCGTGTRPQGPRVEPGPGVSGPASLRLPLVDAAARARRGRRRGRAERGRSAHGADRRGGGGGLASGESFANKPSSFRRRRRHIPGREGWWRRPGLRAGFPRSRDAWAPRASPPGPRGPSRAKPPRPQKGPRTPTARAPLRVSSGTREGGGWASLSWTPSPPRVDGKTEGTGFSLPATSPCVSAT